MPGKPGSRKHKIYEDRRRAGDSKATAAKKAHGAVRRQSKRQSKRTSGRRR